VSEPSQDQSICTVIVKRLVEERLPMIELLKAKVDQGEVLNDYDMMILKEAIADRQRNAELVKRNPQYLDLASRVAHLYKEIMDKAVENEKNKLSHN
jgi:hypothetical protein